MRLTSGNGVQRALPAATRSHRWLLPGFTPVIVLLKQPLHLVAHPTADGFQIQRAAALPRASSGDPIHDLSTCLQPDVPAAFSAFFHGSTLPTPLTQPLLTTQTNQHNGHTSKLQRQKKGLHLNPSPQTAAGNWHANGLHGGGRNNVDRRHW